MIINSVGFFLKAFLEGCFMSRFFMSLVVLASGGVLFISGCEPSGAPSAPPPPATPPASKGEEPKKTSAIVPSGSAIAATASAAAGEAVKATALTCGMKGCTSPGLPQTSLVHAGKTVNFCCDDCRAGYKKANNL